jgi:hypothetical protein
MYKKAGDFLKRFSGIAERSDSLKDEVIKILKSEGVNAIEKKDIILKKDILFLKVSALKKAQVFLKKEKIISAFKKGVVTDKIKEIV